MTTRYELPSGLSRWPHVGAWGRDLWRHWCLQQDGWDETQTAQYLDHDRYVYGFGVTKDGQRAGLSDIGDPDVNWLYLPTPKAITLHAEPTANTLWGGAAGGAKSFSARWEAIRCCDAVEDFRVIMIRRELEELRRTHLDKLEREVLRLNLAFNKKVVTLTQKPPVLAFERTGAKIIFGHCNNAGDEEKYLSEDYDLFIGDEATQLLRKQIIGIAGRIRNDPKRDRLGRMILTTNPGGPSHKYCVNHFITKTVTLAENPKYDPADYTFIPARLYDNPFYMDPDGTFTTYEKRLSAFDVERRQQLLNGDWTSVVGQFFPEFKDATHVARLAA